MLLSTLMASFTPLRWLVPPETLTATLRLVPGVLRIRLGSDSRRPCRIYTQEGEAAKIHTNYQGLKREQRWFQSGVLSTNLMNWEGCKSGKKCGCVIFIAGSAVVDQKTDGTSTLGLPPNQTALADATFAVGGLLVFVTTNAKLEYYRKTVAVL